MQQKDHEQTRSTVSVLIVRKRPERDILQGIVVSLEDTTRLRSDVRLSTAKECSGEKAHVMDGKSYGIHKRGLNPGMQVGSGHHRHSKNPTPGAKTTTSASSY